MSIPPLYEEINSSRNPRQTSDINRAEAMKYDTMIITIPPTIALRDCCFLP